MSSIRGQSLKLKSLPSLICRTARRKLQYIHEAAELNDLKVPPGKRLDALKGDRNGFQSIRINHQWRIVFKWEQGNTKDVSVEDYH